MSFTSGNRLGNYEIVAPIGAGGMGEVYRARDVKLKREVAIKVLPANVSADPEKIARFEREAVLLASLNHPNVATLHGFEELDGKHVLVMECVEGETLAERIARGPIPIIEAIPLFVQIAEALEAAHAKGVIHRDLKPANIKLTPTGVVKVLDFGLAKVLENDEAPRNLSESPTVTRGTAAGVILGTAAYMSPEQARGQTLDARTDVWSFGCCCFEALTGRATFARATVSDTIAAILEREPRWDALPAATPPALVAVLRRMLRKDPHARLHNMADVRIWIDEAMHAPAATAARAALRGSRFMAAILVAAIVAAALTWMLVGSGAEVSRPVTRLAVPLPEGAVLAQDTLRSSVAIAPDGRTLGFVARADGTREIYIRRLDTLEARVIEDGAGAEAAFFSPDSAMLGFLAGGHLMKVPVSGGGAVEVIDVAGGGGEAGFMWSSNGDIVFAPFHNTGLYRVSDDGGERVAVSMPDRERGVKSHRHPRPLPRDDAVLFTLVSADITSADEASIAVMFIESGEYRVLVEGGSSGEYSRSGHLVYARKGALFAVPFDIETLSVTGTPVSVVEGVAMSATGGAAQFNLAEDGSLLYAPGSQWGENHRIVWVDRDGRTEALIDTRGRWTSPTLSPGGNRLLVRNQLTNSSLWMFDLERAALTRVVHRWDNGFPSWSPDGRRFAFASSRNGGQYNLFVQTVDGGEPMPLTEGDHTYGYPNWTPDETTLVFDDVESGTGLDIWWMRVESGAKPEPFVRTDANEQAPSLSPDGRWVAYTSDETGRDEIYARPFPPGPGVWRVSTDGGALPRWSRIGSELFYRNGDAMLAVSVETGADALVLGTPRHLFDHSSSGYYDVSPDGRRFIMGEEADEPPRSTQLILVQNFDEELKRLVPPTR